MLVGYHISITSVPASVMTIRHSRIHIDVIIACFVAIHKKDCWKMALEEDGTHMTDFTSLPLCMTRQQVDIHKGISVSFAFYVK